MSRWFTILLLVSIILGFLVYIAQPMWKAPALADITTDPDSACQFSNLELNSYLETNAAVQRTYYPDIKPIQSAESAASLFRLAKEVALTMPGWNLKDANEKTLKIEGRARSIIPFMKDDFVVEVYDQGEGSVLQMRSKSHFGKRDFGSNAKRIREFSRRVEQVLILKEGE